MVLMVTARCNAACEHCSTSCGPYRTEQLPRETMLALIRDAASLAGTERLEISITGGEPFLDFALLREIVAYGTARGAHMSCVSNAYWATSTEKATSLLSQMQAAGLRLIAFSTSPFHQRFVPAQRVQRALGAAQALGLARVLKYVKTRSDPQDDAAIVAWGTSAGAQDVLRQGAELPQSEYARTPGLPRGRCPGAVLNISEEGTAYTCCTPGAITKFLALGTVSSGFASLHDAFYLGGKQQILRRYGPSYFARRIAAEGLGGRLRKSYTSVCELCTHIASDPEMSAVAERAADRFEQRQLQAFLRGPEENEPSKKRSKEVPISWRRTCGRIKEKAVEGSVAEPCV
jgi:hypothetical protein